MSAPEWSLWVERLKERVPMLQVVGLASDFTDAVRTKATNRPYQAYVIPISSAANKVPHGSLSRVTELTWTVAVAFSVLHFSDPTGERAASDFATVQSSIWDALIGWVPTQEQGAHAVLLGPGRRLGYSGPAQWWADRYTYKQRIS